MASGTIQEAADAMGGRIVQGDPETIWSGAVLDSRKVAGGELFFAFAGEQTDGHRFVGDSLERGAAGAIIESEVEASEPEGGLIRVEDSLAALHSLTRHVRDRVPERLVAVTGSAGKTTTKELLAAMLAKRFRVAHNPGNLNNLLGFPISLLGVPEGTEWMVAEMGMSTPGELSQLAGLGRPDLVVYTNVRPVHLEFFDSLQGIAEAKAELLEGLSRDGTVIANADDPEVVRIVDRHPARKVWYGLGPDVLFGAEQLEDVAGGGTRFMLRVGSERYRCQLPLYGRYNVENFLAAAACAVTVGVEAEEVVEAAATAESAPMRGVVHALPQGGFLVDDSYNSNPDALSQSLASCKALAGDRHWAVIGSMLELGPETAAYHRRLGRQAVQAGFAPILAVGSEARPLSDGAVAAGGDAAWFGTAEEAAQRALEVIRPGDVVLVKGSRGVGLDRVVERLLGTGPSSAKESG